MSVAGSGVESQEEGWRLADLPACEQPDGWRKVVAETHLPWDIAPVYETRRGFEAWMRRRRLGDLAVLDCVCEPCSGGRGAPELRASPGEYVGVLFVLGGREVLEQDGRQVELRGGEFAVWDSVRPARFSVLEPLRKRTLLIPRARLAALHPQIERTTAARRQRSQAAALLLSEHVQAAASAASLLDRVGARAAAAAAVELLAAALEPARRPTLSVSRAALLDTVDAYIERHLGDPALSPATIADAHSVSVRTVHALFHERGESVTRNIRRRRLHRCRSDLGGQSASSITSVAYRWGFTDSAHFSRAFREQYDESPREWRSRVSAENTS